MTLQTCLYKKGSSTEGLNRAPYFLDQICIQVIGHWASVIYKPHPRRAWPGTARGQVAMGWLVCGRVCVCVYTHLMCVHIYVKRVSRKGCGKALVALGGFVCGSPWLCHPEDCSRRCQSVPLCL